MGISFNELKGTYKSFACARHPVTRKPVTKAREGLKTKTEALRMEKELIKLLDRELRMEREPTWGIFIQKYFEELDRRDLSKKTVENVKLCLQAHTLDIWKNKLISEILPNEIRELIRSKDSVSESHRKNLLKYVRGGFNHAVDIGLLKGNPTPQMKFRIGDKIQGVLTPAHINKLLMYAKENEPEWYPIWATAVYTGLRNGELYALTWDKIDFDNRKALIDSGWDNKNGFKDYTKSGRDRVIELAPDLIHILKELKIKNGASSVFVLPRISSWDKGEQARELRKVLQGLGLPVVRFHDLRASWATVMLTRGIVPLKVMAMGGWEELKTMQVYIRKAGVDIAGISDSLSLHNPRDTGEILSFQSVQSV